MKAKISEKPIQSKFINYYGYDISHQKGQQVFLNLDRIDGLIMDNGLYFPIMNGKTFEFGMSFMTFEDFKEKITCIELMERYKNESKAK